MVNYLFVCFQNKIRSKVISQYFSRLMKEKGIGGNVESAGLYVESEKPDSWDVSSHQVTKEMCSIADIIFVMEEEMGDELVKKYSTKREKIINLDILDTYYGPKFNEDFFESLGLKLFY
ncbi:MAG: protein tyrosine phosphatase [bacterium]